MAIPVGQLYSSLTLESASFITGMKKAADQTARSTKEINDKIGSIVNAGKALALAAVSSEAFAIGEAALDYASSLGEVAQQLGVTTDELQIYRYAASQVGVEQEAMDKGLAKLTQTIGKAATGGEAQAKVFRALGIDVRDANGHVRTAGQVLPEIAGALEGVTDPAQRAAAEVALFGKTGQQLDTLLAGGKGQINELAQAARELGLVLSSDQIQKADDAADKMSAVKQVLQARIAATVADNADAIFKLASALERLAVAGANALNFLGGDQRDVRTSRFLKFIQPGVDWLGNQGTIGRFLKSNNLIAPSAADFEKKRSEKMLSGLRPSSAGSLLSADAVAAFAPKASVQDIAFGGGAGGAGGARGGRRAGGSGDDGLQTLLDRLQPVRAIEREADEAAAKLRARFKGEQLTAMLDALGADTRAQIDGLIGPADDLAKRLADWSDPLVDFDDKLRQSGSAIEAAGRRMEDGFERSRREVEALGEAIDREFVGGLMDAARGFGSLEDVALGVLESIGNALLTKLTPPGGSGGLGSLIAGAILGGGGGGFSLNTNAVAAMPTLAGPALGSTAIPGFATGVDAVVGGSGPTDSKLVQMRVTPGELVKVRRPSQGGGDGMTVNQTIQFTGGVDLATRGEVERMGLVSRNGAIAAIREMDRRR